MPLLTRVKPRHARIRRNGQGKYSITAVGEATVAVNGHSLKAPRQLVYRDRIDLGDSGCAWRFEQPVSDSFTAVLQRESGSIGSLRLPGGVEVDRVILAADRVEIAAYGASHIEIPRLSCERLWLTRDDTDWQVHVQGGHFDGALDATALPLAIPDDWSISSDLDLAEYQARLLMSRPPADSSTRSPGIGGRCGEMQTG